ncbi:hypothetical protein B0O99DRAFT_104002 [Bisporella sp. PMI_857]|nr:hypothetical protein B0O99DRAFT_104002 [Bisporella sp. PMI_857]
MTVESSHSSKDGAANVAVLKTCSTCSKAKVKCVASDLIGGKCQRCHRLDKICEPLLPAPRKRRADGELRRNTRTQVEILEQKVDDIVTLLKSTQGVEASPGTQNTAEQSSTPFSLPLRDSRYSNPASVASSLGTNITASQTSATTSYIRVGCSSLNDMTADQRDHPPPPAYSPAEFSGITLTQADSLLAYFRSIFCPYFPFVVIPQAMSASQLYRCLPFTYLAILAVTSRNAVHSKEFGKLLMKRLAERLFMNGERSMDLLLGVIIYAGWCYQHFWNVPQLTSLLSAATTLACDLGLTRPRKEGPRGRSYLEDAIRETSWGTTGYMSLLKTPRTIEEKRAYLGVYFLCSISSTFFRRFDNWMRVQYSPYVEECRQALETSDVPTDKAAAFMVRLQILVERIHQSPWQSQSLWQGKSESLGADMSTIFLINAFRESLRDLKKALPPELEHNPVILVHYHAAESLVYEAGLFKTLRNTHVNGPDLYRVELLSACLQANKDLFEIFFSIPVNHYFSFSVPFWSNFSAGLIILQMLCSFEHPDWNLEYVHQTYDFGRVIDRCIEKFDLVNEVEDCQGNDVFVRSAARMKKIKEFIGLKRTGTGHEDLKPSHEPSLDFSYTGNNNYLDFIPFVDESWLWDIMEPFDYQFTGMEDLSSTIPNSLTEGPTM